MGFVQSTVFVHRTQLVVFGEISLGRSECKPKGLSFMVRISTTNCFVRVSEERKWERMNGPPPAN